MQQLTLADNDIHIWYTRPERHQQPELLLQYHSLLSADESVRQQRYHFSKDRHSALITRAFVRDLLSRYADVPPRDWRFIKGEKDKPEIEKPPLPLRFNLSHTKGLIICAVTLEQDIGIDVEYMDRNNDILSIADRYFSPVEINALFSLPQAQQRSRFFDYWTLKESYIKACGLGLAIPLDHFSFIIGNKEGWQNSNIRLEFDPRRADNPANWQSWLFYPGNSHRIAMSIHSARQPVNICWFESTPLIAHTAIKPPILV